MRNFTFVQVNIRFRVQFGINLHKWVFQKAEISRAASASAISAFWKTHLCKLILNWTRKAIFFPIKKTEKIFQSFRTQFLSLLYMRSLAIKISHCLSANHNPELRCIICTGVTPFAALLHFLHCCYTWSALLSANHNRVIFFMCIIIDKTGSPWCVRYGIFLAKPPD